MQDERSRRTWITGARLQGTSHRQIAFLGLILCAPWVTLWSSSAEAQACTGDWSARLVSVEGNVESRRSGRTDWSPAKLDDVLCIGDALRSGQYGRAAVQLPDETITRLDQNTTVTFVPSQNQKRSWLELLRGAVHIISRGHGAVEVLTPFANAGIEGTEFVVVVGDEKATVTVYEGQVAVSNAAGTANATSGQSVSASAGQMPVAQGVVRPRDAVQWTLYYPPVLGSPLPEPDASPSAQQARGAKFYVGRAERRLGVGRVTEAREDLAQSLSLDPNNVSALALQSVVALTLNDKDEALRLANDAVSRDPASATALIARSYAQQSFFDVSSALATLQDAVRREPRNALAWARLSELWLSVGDVDQGLQAAQTAVSIDPSLPRTQTVLGFAYLTRVDIDEAVASFERAITLDQGAPLPRLGLGLARFRQGDVAAGREQIEIAVALDPGNALIRSYVGKAYYEEKRDGLAESQLKTAKELDPLDPTAWFYDAIRKQSTNDLVGALEDVQQSIELNDNRAVYRSRLLLDEDLAARSASLGRIYRDLDFEPLALIEGWKSVDSDPSDYSGHRLLADVYSAMPLHEIARVDELFRSQLLQPINITPIQPQLAQSNTFLMQNAGPTELAFNEFNPMFDRNRWAIQGDGVTGSNGTRGEDIVVSGVHDKLSYSVGQFHFETDGFRENNDFKQDVANAFVQYRATPQTTVLAEIRSSKIDKGDLELLFDPEDYNPTERQTEDVDSVHLGARHVTNDRLEWLGALTYQDAKLTADVPGLINIQQAFDGYGLDLQNLYRIGAWLLTSGIAGVSEHVNQTTTFLFPFTLTSSDTRNVDQSGAYMYASVGVARAKIVLGGSFDSIHGTTVDDQWFNPKLGLTWDVGSNTTVRAAAFRTVQGPIVSRQNIQPRLEPTEVAGFNQFFFGDEGEVAWRYGVAVDHSFSARLYTGIEASRRDVDVPYIDATVFPPSTLTVKIQDDTVRAYANWVVAKRISASAGYVHENIDNHGTFFAQGYSDLRTDRVPLHLNFHGERGFSVGLTATWVDQRGTFEDTSVPPPFPPIEEGDTFWVVDASLRYRLPKRWGTITLSVNNLFDEKFKFQDSDPENPGILPERVVLLRFTLAH
jgi:tetratricopeptide (TPR) repeat protein